ncbi:NadR type nicotinamide-nucleotide adenylyltransferase [Neobacillus niacini]|uniref:AAA family ATPase n=1 Tax=Neobacillus niacini TaxID=86668 RepID=UPI00285F1ADC|nr:AAA family ATPase [Neobacillus niacini]MDR7077358.1 NadR type nicotinamide-nucleotide adenylyltransferase [Neobacillus niacini]
MYRHWEYIPNFVKPYFVKKIVLVGTESCGKSTLTKNLAKIYNTTYVEEYGRTVCEELGGCDGIMIKEDYQKIAYGHKMAEYQAIEKANKLVFIDAEANVTQFYSNLYNNQKHTTASPCIHVWGKVVFFRTNVPKIIVFVLSI